MRWSGICTNWGDHPKPSPVAPDIGTRGNCLARLVGKFTHRGTGYGLQRVHESYLT